MAAKTNPSNVTGPLRIGSVPQTTFSILYTKLIVLLQLI